MGVDSLPFSHLKCPRGFQWRSITIVDEYYVDFQEDLEEDPDEVNNNEVEEGDADKDETASVGSSQHSGKQINEKT